MPETKEVAVFAMAPAQRWQPNWPLLGVLRALSLFLSAMAGAVAALRGPRLLRYQVAPTARSHWWRVTAVWPASFAWDAGLRPGTLIQSAPPPATRGSTTVRVWAGRCCRTVTIPPRGETLPELAWLELALATLILALGAGTLLFARARRPALLLWLFCLVAAVGLCGVAAFAHGAVWGSVLFETCWFALLPPLTLSLATSVPPGGRTLARGWRLPVLLGTIIVALEAVSIISLYASDRYPVHAPETKTARTRAIGRFSLLSRSYRRCGVIWDNDNDGRKRGYAAWTG